MSETIQTPEDAPMLIQVVDVADGTIDAGDVITAVVDPTPDGTDDLVMVTNVDADGDGEADDAAVVVMNDTDGDGVIGSEGDETVVMIGEDLTVEEGGEGNWATLEPETGPESLGDDAFAAAGLGGTDATPFADSSAGAMTDDFLGASAGADMGAYSAAAMGADTGYTAATDLSDSASVSAGMEAGAGTSWIDAGADAEAAQQAAQAETATAAQAQADEYVAAGNYEAAAQARESAEDAAWEAGDSSMLHGSHSIELADAASHQENAEYYEAQQAEFAAAGDYEAAKEAAANVSFETGEADFQAGGSDHTGQADAQYAALDNADWHQDWAQEEAAHAADYAADGNLEMAQLHADNAEYQQGVADDFGVQGEPGNILAEYDPSSQVDGSTYAPLDDTTSYDTTSYADTSASSYDSYSSSSYDSSYDTE